MLDLDIIIVCYSILCTIIMHFICLTFSYFTVSIVLTFNDCICVVYYCDSIIVVIISITIPSKLFFSLLFLLFIYKTITTGGKV